MSEEMAPKEHMYRLLKIVSATILDYRCESDEYRCKNIIKRIKKLTSKYFFLNYYVYLTKNGDIDFIDRIEHYA